MFPDAKKMNIHNLEGQGQGWPLDNGISELSRTGRPHAKVFASSWGSMWAGAAALGQTLLARRMLSILT